MQICSQKRTNSAPRLQRSLPPTHQSVLESKRLAHSPPQVLRPPPHASSASEYLSINYTRQAPAPWQGERVITTSVSMVCIYTTIMCGQSFLPPQCPTPLGDVQYLGKTKRPKTPIGHETKDEVGTNTEPASFIVTQKQPPKMRTGNKRSDGSHSIWQRHAKGLAP